MIFIAASISASAFLYRKFMLHNGRQKALIENFVQEDVHCFSLLTHSLAHLLLNDPTIQESNY